LFDDLAPFLGPEYEHLLSDEFLKIKSPMLPCADYTIHYDVDQGSHTQIQYPLFMQGSVTELLDSMLSTPKECSADMSNYQTDLATKVLSPNLTFVITQDSACDSAMDEEIGSDVDSKALMAQVRRLI